MNIAKKLRQKIDHKTKPLGALGRLEELALQIGTLQNTLTPVLHKPTIVVFAADHGIAHEGVSAYPQAVTHQMVLNFVTGGAAINVFCRQHGIALEIVDAGVNFDFPLELPITRQKIGYGTQSSLRGNAMTHEQVTAALDCGADVVRRIASGGCNVIGFGEMGIGNTSSASLLFAAMCHIPIRDLVGRGTGLDDTQLAHKSDLLARVYAHHTPVTTDPHEALAAFGGFEIAQMCGAMLEARRLGMLILVDGYIASSAFVLAEAMGETLRPNAVFCHLSHELGHQLILKYLNVEPLLNLSMRLGEGTACAVAYPLLKSAVAFLNDMASFESAGVSQKR